MAKTILGGNVLCRISLSDPAQIILAFQPLMLNRIWRHAIVLLMGAILAPGKRTVSSILRITGRHQERAFQNYHRVLNREAWDLLCGSQILLGLPVQQFALKDPMLFGIDDTIERCWHRRFERADLP